MNACSIKVRGIVQGVGFRPFVFRLAHANTLAGWVLNGTDGVEIFVEGSNEALNSFVHELKTMPPPASRIAEIEVRTSLPAGFSDFTIRESQSGDFPTTRISPDLPLCDECLAELFNPADLRYHYPYINCTNCGPRHSIIRKLPYDRRNTTMSDWPLDDFCASQYEDPVNRRFHAQPVACPGCGPGYQLRSGNQVIAGSEQSICKAAELLRAGRIVAIKGIGGYHLACDGRNSTAVHALRERKYRKEKPFAVMARDIDIARSIVELSTDAEALLTSVARPIVLGPARSELQGVAPENRELGVMLPYTPLHHLLFNAGAPDVLVMTSANRSSEPIAYEDTDAIERLSGIADAFLVGERPIARRVDDSVARAGIFGPSILRRARGYAPGAVATIPSRHPILAFGADLKNTVTLVVEGQAFVSQHIGDLNDFQSLRAYRETIDDLISMYQLQWKDVLLVHDLHPQFASTAHALGFDSAERGAVQHHRAHIASVLAEQQNWTKRVIGVSFDGTGYGDDGTIWGGEIFIGSLCNGFERIAHLRSAFLPGGDAAAQFPVQAAAGFLSEFENLPDLGRPPFEFPSRYNDARNLVHKGVRTFTTTSMGRLFDTAAAITGFTRECTYEGQAAIWLEQMARDATNTDSYPFPFIGKELDYRPLLKSVVEDRACNRATREIARAFQRGIAAGLHGALDHLCKKHDVDTVALSGGVFQNELLLEDLDSLLKESSITIWTNHRVPANDGGISLGQAALAAFDRFDHIEIERNHATIGHVGSRFISEVEAIDYDA